MNQTQHMTENQIEVLKSVLSEWADDRCDVLYHASNYELSRVERNTLKIDILDVATILEDVCGVEGAKDKYHNMIF